MEQSNKIDRKEAIKRTALLIGGTVFTPNILGVLQGCKAKPDVNWKPVLFNNDQAKLITSLVDVIIPKDEYPSASEVGVPAFIESMIKDVYTKEQREKFMAGLDEFAEKARLELELDYYDADEEQRYELAYNENQGSIDIEREEDAPFFLRLKDLTLLGYFTSEIGATQVLRFEEIPGMYDGCMPFDEIGKTWAT